MKKMTFNKVGTFIIMSEYFHDDESDERIGSLLNEYFKEWIFIRNEADDSINSIVRSTGYEYQHVEGRRVIIVKYNMEYTGGEGNPKLDKLNDITVSQRDGHFELMYHDFIYNLITEDEEKPVERIRWYRKGKLHEMKTFEQLVSDIDPYGEERWEDDSDYRDISDEDLTVQRQLLSTWIFEDNSVDFG